MRHLLKIFQFRLLIASAAIFTILAFQTICYAQKPIIQTTHSTDPDTEAHNANSLSTQKTGRARNPIIWADSRRQQVDFWILIIFV